MKWNHGVSYFFGGVFLANGIPHLVSGATGHSFQSPFAKPPGVGLSSPVVNVLWGSFNLAIGHVLVRRVGKFDPNSTPDVAALGAGAVLTGVMMAHYLGKFHSGDSAGRS